MNEPIGWVLYGGGSILAELIDTNQWRVHVGQKRDAALEKGLAVLYADAYRGPQDGLYGRGILQDLAKRMDGTWFFTPQPPTPGDAAA